MNRRGWDAAWAAWLAAVLASFAVLETLALRWGRPPTLSRTLARWLGVHPRTRWGRVAPAAFLAFWAALTAHVVRIRAD